MKKHVIAAIAATFVLAGIAHAQTAGSGVTESTDPSRAAAVEAHARELRESQAANQTGASDQSSMRQHREKMHRPHAKHHRKSEPQSSSGASSSTQTEQGMSGQGPAASQSPGSSK